VFANVHVHEYVQISFVESSYDFVIQIRY